MALMGHHIPVVSHTGCGHTIELIHDLASSIMTTSKSLCDRTNYPFEDLASTCDKQNKPES